jgi:predicted dehydrogenase
VTVPRIVVIGAGHMGALHVAKVSALAEQGLLELAGVVDVEPERARAIAPAGVPAVSDFRELLDVADAAIVAVPTVHHFAVVGEALAGGLDVLVEKPIAASLPEASKLLDAAAAEGRVLQVGHLEWFNPAMRTVESLVTSPRFFEAHRLGPFPARATDVDVVRDLMIHDLDIVQRLLGEEPSEIDAIGVPVLTDEVDIANARLHFPGGCVANFTASRVSVTPVRKIRFFQPDAYFSLDFLERNVTIARRARAAGSGERTVDLRQLVIDRGDALEAQLRVFLDALVTREVSAGGGHGALAALRTALRVIDAMPPLQIPDDDDLPVVG